MSDKDGFEGARLSNAPPVGLVEFLKRLYRGYSDESQ